MPKRKSLRKKRVSRKKTPKKRVSRKKSSKKRVSRKKSSKKRVSRKKYKLTGGTKLTLKGLNTRLKRVEAHLNLDLDELMMDADDLSDVVAGASAAIGQTEMTDAELMAEYPDIFG